MRFVAAIGAALLVLAAGPVVAQDREGEDHPLLPRYPGAVIDDYRAPSLDEITIPTGQITSQDASGNRQVMEGQVTQIGYRVEPAVAPLQIQRYYADRLAKDGFQTVFSCTGPACGRDMGALVFNSGKVAPPGFDGLFNDRIRVVVARRGATWMLLHIADSSDRSIIYEAVVEDAKPAEAPPAGGE